jgi:hypothetical protein
VNKKELRVYNLDGCDFEAIHFRQSILAQTESTFGMVMEPTMEKYRLNGIPEAAYYIPNFISPSEEEYLVSKVSILRTGNPSSEMQIRDTS